MEEAKEETDGISTKNEERHSRRHDDRTRVRGFSTRSVARCCVVDTCEVDHLPWRSEVVKKLRVEKRK